MPSEQRSFAHLHQHTAYSLLDGAARIKDLISWAKEVSPDNPAVAMTDHGNMHGAVEFYKAAESAGVKPIIGFEAYVTPGSRFDKRRPSSKLDGGYFHLTLLAKNFVGYRNLCKLNSRAWLEGFYMKPRADHELLREYSEGVIALSGCLGAQIPRSVLDLGEDAGEEALRQYLDIYGEDFFIELQDHGLDEQRRVNPVLKSFADRYGLGMVATNDGHYVRREDAKAHEALLAIQTKTTLSDPKRFRFPCDEFYVKTPQEMATVIPESEYPGALSNTLRVAEMCDLTLPIGPNRVYQMPELPLPEGRTLAEQLRIQTYQGLISRYSAIGEDLYRHYLAAAKGEHGSTVDKPVEDAVKKASSSLDDVLLELARLGEGGRRPKTEDETYDSYEYAHLAALKEQCMDTEAVGILERAEFELGVIIAMGFPDYFLIVSDFINWAKDQAIAVGPGRGSGAGSIVAFALRITDIDPLEFGLLFERFLNPHRISMPDFDIDFSDVRRGEVIEYVRRKYGEDRVAHIATFGTMASRAAIKDAARVLEAPYSDADKVSKLIPVVFGRSVTIERALEEVSEMRELYEAGAKEYVDVARSLEGLTRHASVHAAGVIISRDPVQELAPVFRSGDGPVVCQYDMGSIEELGFLKMDFLGLRTLSFIEAAVKIVRESRGVELDPDSFPAGDAKTFELLSRGDAAGVFQFESPGMIDTLKKLKPRRIQDLIAVSALYRPGPMENIPSYIRRHHGTEEVQFDDFPESRELLAPILEETYGIPVYQEQIMQIAQAVAGYSLGEADLLRRAMGKKKISEMEKQRKLFEDGASTKGISNKEANRIFDLLEKFANYGFNKCVIGSTQIVLGSGEVVSAEELYGREVGGERVLSTRKDFTLTDSAIADVVENGIKPVFRLSTSLGKEITATANHPFLTLGGWKNLEELEVGDRIASPRVVPIDGVVSWAEHELVLLGWMVSEGNTCHPSGAYLYNSDKTVVDDMLQAANRFPNTTPQVVQRPERADGYAIYLGTGKRGSASNGRSGVRLWLESLDQIGYGANEKHFPPEVFRLRNECLAIMLGRYWSGDGFVASTGNTTPYAATSSLTLARQLQHLLLRFGIVGRLSRKEFSYRGGRIGYTVQLVGRRGIEAFLSQIGPHILAKDEQLDFLRKRLEGVPPDLESVDTIPSEVKRLVDDARRSKGLTWRALEEQSGVCVKEFYGGLRAGKKGFRRSTIRKLAAFLGSQVLMNTCSDDIFWERVVAKEAAGSERTYDLEVPGTHNFVANDIIVHNSHSAAYGVLSYQTAYLKANYPVEFAASLLTVERANSDKVAQYVADARHLGIDVLPPEVNESRSDFTPVGEVIRFGLYGIKNVGDAAVNHVLEERKRGGAFKDLFDFCRRTDASLVNRRALEHLIKSGAFDRLGDRSDLLRNLESATKWGSAQREQAALGQFSLFGDEELQPPQMTSGEPFGELELLRFEKEALGLYISSHPMASYPGLSDAASCPVDSVDAWFEKQRAEPGFKGRARVALAGILQSVSKRPTRKGTMMARFEIADESGAREVVAFSRTYDAIADLLLEDAPAVLVAELSEDGDALRLVADRLIRWDARGQLPEMAIVEFDLADVSMHHLEELRSLLDEHVGVTPVRLRFDSSRGHVNYAPEGLRVDKERLAELERSCPWVRTRVTLDRDALLAPRATAAYGAPRPTATADVPF
ncbi:MAG: DNA polymerase III subunit alpha [Trueperaceae bacterium]